MIVNKIILIALFSILKELIKNVSLKLCILNSEEQLVSIAERTIVEADKDGDQMISFQEFCSALERTDVEQKMSIRFLN